MASVVASSRASSLHHSSSSAPGYFDFTPATQSDAALIQSAMEESNVHRLDAFHVRPSPVFEYPEDAHKYAARPLPPVPTIPALRKPSSAKSLRSLSEPVRPSLSLQNRTITADCINRPLPPLPLRCIGHRRGPSVDSVASSKLTSVAEIVPETAPLSRPRTMRSISFRNFLNRNTYPQAEPQRSESVMSEHSDSSSNDSRHDSVVIVDEILSKTSTAGFSAAGSRRPSTLSLASLRSRKTSQESPTTTMPRPQSSRKGSTSAGTSGRWAIFGREKPMVEDAENIPPMPITPITPPPTSELSCHRCYYYSMRNCNGWVMGGAHGDACESCTMHGFFGSP